MFNHILIPVDLTAKNTRTVETAGRLARHFGARVTLLHVIELIAGMPPEDGFYQGLERRSREQLAKLAAVLADTAAAAQQVVEYGHRVERILGYADDYGVDLIVLSSRPPTTEPPFVNWGTVSHKVAVLGNCPVMLVK